jgi:putative transposase
MIARKVNKGGKLMSRKRRRFSSEFKTQVVLELLLEQKTVAELCSKYEISSQTINDWKHEFLSNASLAFDKTKVVKEYKEQIEKLTKEKEVLSKKLAQEVIEKEWLAGKLKSLDLSIRRNLIDKWEGVQANRVNPSLNRQLRLLGIYKGWTCYNKVDKELRKY